MTSLVVFEMEANRRKSSIPKFGTVGKCTWPNILVCLYCCHGSKLATRSLSSIYLILSLQGNIMQFLQFSFIDIVLTDVVLSLRY